MMINVADGTARKIRLAASLSGMTEGEIVARAIARLMDGSATSTTPEPATKLVPIHAIYEGQLIEALYDPATHRIDVTSGACDGSSYKSPSMAARAVVTAMNPNVSPHRNGWSFWRVTDGGAFLQAIRHDS
jgi:hypothetical protein